MSCGLEALPQRTEQGLGNTENGPTTEQERFEVTKKALEAYLDKAVAIIKTEEPPVSKGPLLDQIDALVHGGNGKSLALQGGIFSLLSYKGSSVGDSNGRDSKGQTSESNIDVSVRNLQERWGMCQLELYQLKARCEGSAIRRSGHCNGTKNSWKSRLLVSETAGNVSSNP